MDQGLNPSYAEKMSLERNGSYKPFCTYEASAFRSTPGSNKLSISPNSNIGTPVESVSIEAMKVETGFIPRRKHAAPAFTPPEPALLQSTDSAAEEMKSSVCRTYQELPQPHYFVSSPPATPTEYSKEDVLPTNVPPVRAPANKSPSPESARKKSRKTPESSNEGNEGSESPQGVNEEKKQKNRVSAQKCRARKKEYIQSLEDKIQSLHAELARCKEEIKSLKEAQSANLMAESNANEYQAKYKEYMAALENALSRDQGEEVLQRLISGLSVLVALIVG